MAESNIEREALKKHKIMLQNAMSEVDKDINKADKADDQMKRENERLQAAMNRRKRVEDLHSVKMSKVPNNKVIGLDIALLAETRQDIMRLQEALDLTKHGNGL